MEQNNDITEKVPFSRVNVIKGQSPEEMKKNTVTVLAVALCLPLLQYIMQFAVEWLFPAVDFASENITKLFYVSYGKVIVSEIAVWLVPAAVMMRREADTTEKYEEIGADTRTNKVGKYLPLYCIMAFVLGIALQLLMTGINSLLVKYSFYRHSFEISPYPGAAPKSLPQLAMAVAATCIFPAVCEELMFRRVMMMRLEKTLGTVWAMAAVSVLFALAHSNISAALQYFAVSMTFCLIMNLTGSCLATMICHFGFNLGAIIIQYVLAPNQITWVLLASGGLIAVSSVIFTLAKSKFSTRMYKPSKMEIVLLAAAVLVYFIT